jgi:hypothetical protein
MGWPHHMVIEATKSAFRRVGARVRSLFVRRRPATPHWRAIGDGVLTRPMSRDELERWDAERSAGQAAADDWLSSPRQRLRGGRWP